MKTLTQFVQESITTDKSYYSKQIRNTAGSTRKLLELLAKIYGDNLEAGSTSFSCKTPSKDSIEIFRILCRIKANPVYSNEKQLSSNDEKYVEHLSSLSFNGFKGERFAISAEFPALKFTSCMSAIVLAEKLGLSYNKKNNDLYEVYVGTHLVFKLLKPSSSTSIEVYYDSKNIGSINIKSFEIFIKSILKEKNITQENINEIMNKAISSGEKELKKRGIGIAGDIYISLTEDVSKELISYLTKTYRI